MTKIVNPEYVVLQGGIKDGEILPITKGINWVEFYIKDGKVRYSRTSETVDNMFVFKAE